MRITRTHDMTEPQAIEWVDRKLSEMMDEFGDSVSGVSRAWRGNVLNFRFSVSAFARFEGTLTVHRRASGLEPAIPASGPQPRRSCKSRDRSLAGPQPAQLEGRSHDPTTPIRTPNRPHLPLHPRRAASRSRYRRVGSEIRRIQAAAGRNRPPPTPVPLLVPRELHERPQRPVPVGRAIPHVLPVQADRRGPCPLGSHRQRRHGPLARHAPGTVPRRRTRLLQRPDTRGVPPRYRDLPWNTVPGTPSPPRQTHF